jgi:hypothetical protein
MEPIRKWPRFRAGGDGGCGRSTKLASDPEITDRNHGAATEREGAGWAERQSAVKELEGDCGVMLIEADYMSRRGEQCRIVCAKRYRGMNMAKGSSASSRSPAQLK